MITEKEINEAAAGAVADEREDEPAAREEKPRVAEDENGAVTVDLAPEATERRTRRERREEGAVERWREKAEKLERDVAELRGYVTARQQQVVPQQSERPADPHAARMEEIREQQEAIQKEIRRAESEAEIDRLKKRFYKLDDEKEEIRERRAEERVAARLRQNQDPSDGIRATLAAEYPDVIRHPGAMTYSRGLYYQMLAEGKPENLETARAAMKAAAEHPRFALRQPTMPAVPAAHQQRFGAVPAAAGTKTTSNQIRLDGDQKKMALAAYPNLDEKEAFAKFARLLHSQEKSAAS